MKNFLALVVIIVFSLGACGDGNDTGGGGDDTGGGTAPTITTAALPGGTVGTAYNQTLTASGDAPVTWSVSVGTLPAGLSLAESGAISGTPTTAGKSDFTVKAANAAGNATKPLSITIATAAPTITTASLPGGRVGTAYSRTLAASGEKPITWSLESGALPADLSLAPNGTISGTPTAEGTSGFTVKATNDAGSDTKSLSITIATGGGGLALIEMVQISGGSFTMGSPTGEVGRSADETQHQVTLTGFYMGKHPVTQAQYEAVMETNPSSFTTLVSPEISTASRPVEFVTWYDAVEFCNKLSEREGLTPVYTMTGRTPASGYPITDATVTADWSTDGYRLPTEAQWEYACRAGTTTMYNTGATIGDSTGWYTVNSDDRTHSVGEKPANAFGLYDMHGNVYEWCWDRYNLNYYSSSPAQDPTGPDSGGGRVRRGGSWDDSSQFLRSAFRGFTDPGIRRFYIGFRVVRPIATGGGNQTLEIEMVQVQGGTFTMGSPTNEPDRYNDETQHPVTLTGFRMGKYPVTQEQYEAVMENNPSVFMIPVAPETSTASRPVEFVTWYDAVEFCNKLSEQEGLTPVYNITGRTPATGYPITGATVTPDWSASGYRLPTEAQWEYACRAGTITAYNTGDTISDDTGWYDSNSGLRTHTVGEKPANAWNLYDMHGNVYEWCWDWYDAGYYLSSSAQDPTGPDSGYTRVARGGTWINSGRYLRSAYRYDYDPDDRGGGIGFRVVLPF